MNEEKTFYEGECGLGSILVTNKRIVSGSTTIPLSQVTKVEHDIEGEGRTSKEIMSVTTLVGILCWMVGAHFWHNNGYVQSNVWGFWLGMIGFCTACFGVYGLWTSRNFVDARPHDLRCMHHLVLYTHSGAERLETVYCSPCRSLTTEEEQAYRKWIQSLRVTTDAISKAIGERAS